MPLTKEDQLFIEEVAQLRFKFKRVFQEQITFFRDHRTEFEPALEVFNARHGHIIDSTKWRPSNDNIDRYLDYCALLCTTVPQNAVDRMALYYVAHAALMCIFSCKMPMRPKDAINLAISRRTMELEGRVPGLSPPENRLTTGLHVRREPLAPLPASSSCQHPMTTTFLADYHRDPASLLGKRYFDGADPEDPLVFKFVSCKQQEGKPVEYEIAYDNDPSVHLPMSAQEVEMLLSRGS